MIQDSIVSLMKKQDLTFDAAEAAVDEIMSGRSTDIQIGAFLVALALKGATIEEFAGAAKGMRNHCDKFFDDEDILEIVKDSPSFYRHLPAESGSYPNISGS